MRTTQRKGDIALTKAIADFTLRGCDVSLPVTESAAYDLVVDNGELYRVQVKYLGKDVASVDLRKVHTNSKGYVVNNYEENAYDWLYIYKEGDSAYLVKKCLVQSTYKPKVQDKLV